MKRKNAATVIVFLIYLFTAVFPLTSLEVGGNFRIENLSFRWDRAVDKSDFTGLNFPVGFSLNVSHQLEEKLTFKSEYVFDNILKNILTTLFTYRGDFFSFGVGPFLGFINTSQILPRIGIASIFKIEWPGVLFAELWLDNSTGNQLINAGDYTQERNNISFGFYVRNAICTLNRLTKNFVQKTATAQIRDTITDYSFKTDIFMKNVPYRINISFGLQNLSKSFTENDTTTIHSLYSIIVGTEFFINLSDIVTINIDLDSSIYSFGANELLGVSNPGPAGYLFRVVTGVSVNISNILKK